jgi:hypothetical protein
MTDLMDEALLDFFVVFYLEGARKHFTYEVSKTTYDRLREAVEDDDIGNITFQAYRPSQQVVVNSRFVQLVHFLWQPKTELDNPLGRQTTIDLYFAGRRKPMQLVADDPEEVFDLLLSMETEGFVRCSIVDADGQEAVLDLRKLVCAELPLGLAQAGEANVLADLEEEI